MKIAVFFPGIGYHVDKPLLYYTKKLAQNMGYEIKDVAYGNFPDGVKGSAEKMQAAFESALTQAEEILADVNWNQYNEIMFVSKSVGTAVAAAYAVKHYLQTRNVFFTPLEQSFTVMEDPGIVFTGTADPWVEKGSIPDMCKQKGYPVMTVEGGNHSLETGDVLLDIENIHKIMGMVKTYLSSFHSAE